MTLSKFYDICICNGFVRDCDDVIYYSPIFEQKFDYFSIIDIGRDSNEFLKFCPRIIPNGHLNVSGISSKYYMTGYDNNSYDISKEDRTIINLDIKTLKEYIENFKLTIKKVAIQKKKDAIEKDFEN